MGEDSDSPLKRVTEGASVVFLGTMLELGIAFVGKAVIARFLEVDQYGAISLGIIALNATATIGLLGMNKGLARYIPRFEDERTRRAIVATGFRTVLVLIVVVAVGLFAFAEELSVVVFDDPQLAPVLRIMAVGVPFWALLELGIGITRGLEIARYRVYTKNILLPASRLLIVAVVFVLGFGITGVAWAYAIAFALSAVVVLVLVRREIPVALSGPSGEPSRLGELVRYSLPLTVSDFSGYVLRNVDLVLLGALQNTSQVGVYNVAYPLARLMSAIQGSFGFLLMPVVSKLQSDERMDEVNRMYKIIVKWITFASLPAFIAMVVFPAPLISLLFGAKYSSGGAALSVLASGFFFGSLMGPSANALKAIGRTRVTMVMTWASLGANLGLNLLLIPEYGFFGAAVATAASIVISNTIGTAMLYRFTGVHPFSRATVQPVLVTVVVVLGAAGAVRSQTAITLPMLVGLYLLFFTLFPVSVLRFGGVQQEDVRLFREVENRTGVDLTRVRELLQRVME